MSDCQTCFGTGYHHRFKRGHPCPNGCASVKTELDSLLDRVREDKLDLSGKNRNEVAYDCWRMFEDLATRFKEESAARDRYKRQSNSWRDEALKQAGIWHLPRWLLRARAELCINLLETSIEGNNSDHTIEELMAMALRGNMDQQLKDTLSDDLKRILGQAIERQQEGRDAK